MDIVLASKSPRRNLILKRLGIPFTSIAADVDELREPLREPQAVSMENAKAKAQKVSEILKAKYPSKDIVIIGADTIVTLEGKILGKPQSYSDAERMLWELSGRTHKVITALYVIRLPSMRDVFGWEETQVKFRELTSHEIKLYLESKEYMDKAGGYGIQGRGVFLVEKIEGDYQNVVGLPIVLLYRLMQRIGVDIFEMSIRSLKDDETHL